MGILSAIKRLSLFTVLNRIIIVGIILTALFITRDIVVWTTAKPNKPIPTRSPNNPTVKDPKELDSILKNNPFSNKPGEFKMITSSDNIAQAASDFKLVGTISGDRRYSFAVLSDKEGRQEMIKVGEPVGSLGTLTRVEKAKVIIRNNGKDTELNLAETVRIEESSPNVTSPSLGNQKRIADLARQTGERTFVVDQQKIQYAIDNPNQIMTDARLLPNISEGIQKGFILREVRPGGIYQSLGLRDGDVLLRINEHNINNPENGLQAFMALKGLERVNLDIIRGGANITLTYLIK